MVTALGRWARCSGAILAALCGCSSTSAPSDAALPSDAFVDSALPVATLSVLGDREVQLRTGATASLVFELRAAGAIRRDTVSFAIDGRGHDSSLSATEATTDEQGRVRVTLLAGHTPALFRVRASAPGATSVFVEVVVTDHGVGALAVLPRYAGTRAGTLSVHLYSGQTCDALVEPSRSLLGRIAQPATFLGLPADISYAVRAELTAEDGRGLASACLDEVAVTPAMTRLLDLTLVDAADALWGAYLATWTSFPVAPTAQLYSIDEDEVLSDTSAFFEALRQELPAEDFARLSANRELMADLERSLRAQPPSAALRRWLDAEARAQLASPVAMTIDVKRETEVFGGSWRGVSLGSGAPLAVRFSGEELQVDGEFEIGGTVNRFLRTRAQTELRDISVVAARAVDCASLALPESVLQVCDPTCREAVCNNFALERYEDIVTERVRRVRFVAHATVQSAESEQGLISRLSVELHGALMDGDTALGSGASIFTLERNTR